MRQQGPCPGEHLDREDNLGMHVQHYENVQARTKANNLRKSSGKFIQLFFMYFE